MPATQADLPANTATETAAAAGGQLRYVIKTALCLVLAFMIPMAMGWPQAQTAAMTMMLIAATGTVADFLQKGILRVLGSVVGAIIGLTLIALFPQERMAYPDQPLRGTFESPGWGIAQSDGNTGYNLLPSIKPVFQWIGLAQRIPVRIKLDEIPPDVELSFGLTASVMIERRP